MRGRLGVAALVCAVALVVSTGATGCNRLIPPSATPVSPTAAQQSSVPTSTSLGVVEVDDYKGQRLDTVASEPDNSIKGPQDVDIKTYRLKVEGEVEEPLSLTYDQVKAMPAFEKVTKLNCVEGWSRTYLWRGVRIKDLLERASYDPGAKTVIFRCYDGYSTSLPLDYVVKNNILLAYGMNDAVTPPERGFPFQVVAEDRWGYKWAKWVTAIEVSSDTNFKGYWEQRGYDNKATLPGQ